MNPAGVWIIAVLTILAILIRPRGWTEALWACVGSGTAGRASAICRRHQALLAAQRGTDVYLFLAGMMVLAELARRQGLFDWLAWHAVAASKGSQVRLFALIYGVGIAVTTLLSNDATAVVLTPAVYAAVKKARTATLPYLFICAFIANAASFVLPISNPANLVVFGKSMPPLMDWLRFFALPSVAAIAVTYALLRFLVRHELRGEMEMDLRVSAAVLVRLVGCVGNRRYRGGPADGIGFRQGSRVTDLCCCAGGAGRGSSHASGRACGGGPAHLLGHFADGGGAIRHRRRPEHGGSRGGCAEYVAGYRDLAAGHGRTCCRVRSCHALQYWKQPSGWIVCRQRGSRRPRGSFFAQYSLWWEWIWDRISR